MECDAVSFFSKSLRNLQRLLLVVPYPYGFVGAGGDYELFLYANVESVDLKLLYVLCITAAEWAL